MTPTQIWSARRKKELKEKLGSFFVAILFGAMLVTGMLCPLLKVMELRAEQKSIDTTTDTNGTITVPIVEVEYTVEMPDGSLHMYTTNGTTNGTLVLKGKGSDWESYKVAE